MALKVGQDFYALGRYDEAVKWLDKAGTGSQQSWLKGRSLREMGRYDEAGAELLAALSVVQEE